MKKLALSQCAAIATAPLVLGLSFSACGGSSNGVEGEAGGGFNVGVGGAAGGNYNANAGGMKNMGGGNNGVGSAPTADANCGEQTADTTKTPVDVLLVLDRSGSMTENIAAKCCCDESCHSSTGVEVCPDTSNCTERWPALTSGIESTISAATGINWGLKLYSSPSQRDSCTVTQGVEVAVGSNSAAAILTNISAVTPSGSTPTARAITAGTAYLKTVTDSNTKVMLLATDGEPNCKSGSTSSGTPDVNGTLAAIDAALTAGYKVYVIGIGTEVGNLDNFAVAGGTDHYYPATSAADLASALDAISKAVSSCTFELSKMPPDPANVAVYLDKELITMDANNGWAFGATAQTVILTGSICQKVTSGEATSVQVLFGCPGQAPPPIL